MARMPVCGDYSWRIGHTTSGSTTGWSGQQPSERGWRQERFSAHHEARRIALVSGPLWHLAGPKDDHLGRSPPEVKASFGSPRRTGGITTKLTRTSS